MDHTQKKWWQIDHDGPEYRFFQHQVRDFRSELSDPAVWNETRYYEAIRQAILELEQHKQFPEWLAGLYGIGAVPLLLSIIYYFFGLWNDIVLYITAAVGILLLGSYLTALLKHVGIAFLISAASILYLTYQFVISQNSFILMALVAAGSVVTILITRVIHRFWDKAQESRIRPYRKKVDAALIDCMNENMFVLMDMYSDLYDEINLMYTLGFEETEDFLNMSLPDPLAEAARKHIIHMANLDNIQYKVEKSNGCPQRIIITQVPKE